VEGAAKVCSPDNVELPGEASPQLNAGASRWYALHVRSRHETVVERAREARDTRFFRLFIGRGGRVATGSSKLMWLCFLGTTFATLTRTSGCQF
jgi:hypothetical protein